MINYYTYYLNVLSLLNRQANGCVPYMCSDAFNILLLLLLFFLLFLLEIIS